MMRAASASRDRRRAGRWPPRKPVTFGGVLDEMPGLVGQLHLHQHVAGEELALGVDLGAARTSTTSSVGTSTSLELVGQALLLGLLADRLRDLLLEARIDVDDVPAHRHRVRLPARGSSARRATGSGRPTKKNSAATNDHRRSTIAGGDHGLLARRPGDLATFLADLLEELGRSCLGHDRRSSYLYAAVRRDADRVAARRAGRSGGDSNPQPPVLETGALPVELHSYCAAALRPPPASPACPARLTCARIAAVPTR